MVPYVGHHHLFEAVRMEWELLPVQQQSRVPAQEYLTSHQTGYPLSQKSGARALSAIICPKSKCLLLSGSF